MLQLTLYYDPFLITSLILRLLYYHPPPKLQRLSFPITREEENY